MCLIRFRIVRRARLRAFWTTKHSVSNHGTDTGEFMEYTHSVSHQIRPVEAKFGAASVPIVRAQSRMEFP